MSDFNNLHTNNIVYKMILAFENHLNMRLSLGVVFYLCRVLQRTGSYVFVLCGTVKHAV